MKAGPEFGVDEDKIFLVVKASKRIEVSKFQLPFFYGGEAHPSWFPVNIGQPRCLVVASSDKRGRCEILRVCPNVN